MKREFDYKRDKLFYDKVEKYYQKSMKRVEKNLDPQKNYNYKFYVDHHNKNIVEIFEGEKFVLKAEYDLAGIYNFYNSVWYWGWNIDVVNRTLVDRSKVIKEFSNYLKKNYEKFDGVEAEELYFRTSNGNFFTSKKNIAKIVKLALYLTKSLWFLPVCYGKDDIVQKCTIIENDDRIKKLEYLLIRKIIQVG